MPPIENGILVHVGAAGANSILNTTDTLGRSLDVAEVAASQFTLGSGFELGARSVARDLTIARTGLRNASLAWAAPISDGGSQLLGYKLTRDGIPLPLLDAATLRFEDENLTQGTTHTYLLRASYCERDAQAQQVQVIMPAPLGVDLGGPFEPQAHYAFPLVPVIIGGEAPYAPSWAVTAKPPGTNPTVLASGAGADFLTDTPGAYTVRVAVTDNDPFSPDVTADVQLDVQGSAPPPPPQLLASIHAQSLRWVTHSRLDAGSTVQGGIAPYQCAWTLDSYNATVLLGGCEGAVLAYDEEGASTATLTVADSAGQRLVRTVPVSIVASPAGDGDGDGVLDSRDNCPATPNTNQLDADQDRSGDVCDKPTLLAATPPATPPPTSPYADTDGDGIADAVDNCKLDSNSQQLDSDRDLIGDACEPVGPTPPPGGTSSQCASCASDTKGGKSTPWIVIGVGGAVLVMGALVIIVLTMAGGTRRPPPRF